MTIQLEPIEKELWEAIKVYDWQNGEYKDNIRMFKNQGQLTKMLIARNGIPQNRWSYFVDPEYNTGRGNKSRKEIFEGNGTRGDDIYEHGNFTKHLKFMIEGPDLPSGFVKQAHELYRGITYNNDFPDLFYSRLISRSYIKSLGWRKSEYGDEIFKLLIDLEVNPHDATRIKRKI